MGLKRPIRKKNSTDAAERVTLFPRRQKEGKSKTCAVKCRKLLKKNIFLILIVIAMVAGIGLGIGLRQVVPRLDNRQVMYLRFPGDLFLQMLELLLIPLIVSSLVAATTTLDPRSSGRMGIRSLVYYLGTTTIAVTIGLVLVLSIRPGEMDGTRSSNGDLTDANNTTTSDEEQLNTADTLLDLVRNLFPNNIVEASFKKIVTKQVLRSQVQVFNETGDPAGHFVYDPVVTKVEGTNVLGIITFSLILGIIISMLGDDGRPLAVFFEALNMAVMKMITLVVWYAPIGVMFLIAAKLVEMDDPVKILTQLGFFSMTVFIGFATHGLFVLPLLFLVLVKKNPFKYLLNMVEALVTVFATASSAATLPVTMRCLIENNGIDSRVVHFITPVGATVNMDGSALYMSIAAVFLAQINGIQLGIGQIVTVGITAIAASIGAAAVPSGSLVVIVMVLTSVGIPTDITLIAALDWLLDRFRGMLNIEGDSFGAGIVAHLSRKELTRQKTIVEHSRFGEKETVLNLKDNYLELP